MIQKFETFHKLCERRVELTCPLQCPQTLPTPQYRGTEVVSRCVPKNTVRTLIHETFSEEGDLPHVVSQNTHTHPSRRIKETHHHNLDLMYLTWGLRNSVVVCVRYVLEGLTRDIVILPYLCEQIRPTSSRVR